MAHKWIWSTWFQIIFAAPFFTSPHLGHGGAGTWPKEADATKMNNIMTRIYFASMLNLLGFCKKYAGYKTTDGSLKRFCLSELSFNQSLKFEPSSISIDTDVWVFNFAAIGISSTFILESTAFIINLTFRNNKITHRNEQEMKLPNWPH